MSMNTTHTKVVLPVRTQRNDGTYSIKANGADAGWSTIACDDVAHAREIMARYPSAVMPAWRNPRAAWNR